MQEPDGPVVHFPTPHEGFRRVLREAKRFNLIISGRRWEKTTGLTTLVCETALNGQWAIYGAPTADQCRTSIDEARAMLGDLGKFNESRMECNVRATGGVILWRSLDNPENARSKTAHRICVDEIADVDPGAWTRVLRPMLMTTRGDFFGAGTPRGHNWVYQLWRKGKDREDSWGLFHAPTLGFRIEGEGIVRVPHAFENPRIQWEEMVEAWEDTPERVFREEYGAEFIEDGAGVFRNVDALATGLPLLGPEEGHAYFIGADWGQQKDYTCFVVYDATDKREVFLDRFRRMEYPIVEQRFVELCRRWQPRGIVAEENSLGKPIIEHLQRKGLRITPFMSSVTSTAEWVEMLALAFERRTITILKDETHIAELKAFRGERLPGGRWRYGAPGGEIHDDTVDALGFALWGASNVLKPATASQRRKILARIA